MTIIKQTFADQAYKQLKLEIINGLIKGGSKITLKLLQNKYNLSTTPLREAMNRLISEGLLIHVTNVGANVVTLAEKDIIELYDICRILDTSALNFAYINNPIGLKESLSNSIEKQEYSLVNQDSEAFNKASDEFHDIIYTYANNERLYESSKRYRNQIAILTNRYHSDASDTKNILTEHKSIAAAINIDNIDKALELFNEHFSNGKNIVLSKYIKQIP